MCFRVKRLQTNAASVSMPIIIPTMIIVTAMRIVKGGDVEIDLAAELMPRPRHHFSAAVSGMVFVSGPRASSTWHNEFSKSEKKKKSVYTDNSYMKLR
jgi:hypothetical protein